MENIFLCHITTVPQTLGFLRGNINYMKDRGFEIGAISSPGERLNAFGEAEHIPVHSVALSRRITPLNDLKAVYKMCKLFSRIHPTIVHSHTPKGGLLGMISAWINRTPIRIYHIRGLPYMSATGRKHTLLMTTERIACRLAHRVFCVSHSIRQVAIADGICPPDKIVVFAGGSGNGVDSTRRFNPSRFRPEEVIAKRAELGVAIDETVIGFVGRMVSEKGVGELAGAWRLLREQYPLTRLVLVGAVEIEDPVSPESLQILEDDERVILTGRLANIEEIYPIFDILVLPTYREGFPNVILEAAAMELPVVATHIPGCVDAVQDGVTGMLVPPRNIEVLASAIRKYLDDPDLRRRHGLAGRERVLRDFRQEAIWEAMYQEYCRLLKEKGIEISDYQARIVG